MKLLFINSTPAGICKVLTALENKTGGKISDYVHVSLEFVERNRKTKFYDIYDENFLEPVTMDIMFADENFDVDELEFEGTSYLSLKERKRFLEKKITECNQKIEAYKSLNNDIL